MLTHGEDVEAHALRRRGWTISAIARHLDRDRKTVRGYLNGARTPGVRARSRPDPLAPFDYLAARFADDCHVWASALHDEVKRLGYEQSYQSFVRQLRSAGLRPHCEACSGVKGRDTIEIDHPPGEEIQWDWFERRNAPWGGTAYVLLGTRTLPYSGRVRGVLAEKTVQAHLIGAMHEVMLRLGGTPRIWRTDRLATVIVPGSRDVQASFAPVAKHYGAVVEPCPARRGNRKGAVESSVRFVSGRWWRTMGDKNPEDAQRVNGHRDCPTDGHELRPADGQQLSPRTDGEAPHGRPRELPAQRVGRLRASVAERHHPLARRRVGEADRLAVGEHDMGVMEQAIDQSRGDGAVHQLVKSRGVQVRGQGDPARYLVLVGLSIPTNPYTDSGVFVHRRVGPR